MLKKYNDLYNLIQDDENAYNYFNNLPEYVKSTMTDRADSINSFESLRRYAENVTQGDK